MNGAILNTGNGTAHGPGTAPLPHLSLDMGFSNLKLDTDLPGEGIGFLGAPDLLWDVLFQSSLTTTTTDGSTVAGIDDSDDANYTSSPDLEGDEQEFVETAEAMRMRPMISDRVGGYVVGYMKADRGTGFKDGGVPAAYSLDDQFPTGLMAMMAHEEMSMCFAGYKESWNYGQGLASAEFADYLRLFGSG